MLCLCGLQDKARAENQIGEDMNFINALAGMSAAHPDTVKKLTVKKVGPKFYIYAHTPGRHPCIVGRYDSLDRARRAAQSIGRLARSYAGK